MGAGSDFDVFSNVTMVTGYHASYPHYTNLVGSSTNQNQLMSLFKDGNEGSVRAYTTHVRV